METDDPQSVFDKLEKELTKAKHKSFGKVKTYSKNKHERELEKLQHKKCYIASNKNVKDKVEKIEEINDKMTNVLEKIKTVQYERDLNNLQDMKRTKERLQLPSN